MLVGGTREALAAVIHDSQLHGAERTTMLPVAIPSHTPLLANASDRFREALAKAHLAAEMPTGFRLLSGMQLPLPRKIEPRLSAGKDVLQPVAEALAAAKRPVLVIGGALDQTEGVT
jgi:malonyl CoA-acyl carrier protein transacylase